VVEATPALFERIPRGLFGPLGDPYAELYWELLATLYRCESSGTVPLEHQPETKLNVSWRSQRGRDDSCLRVTDCRVRQIELWVVEYIE
jgi:hypothetical protein